MNSGIAPESRDRAFSSRSGLSASVKTEKDTLLCEDLRHRKPPSGNHVRPVNGVAFREDADVVSGAVHGRGLPPRLDDDDHAASGLEPFEGLFDDLGVGVVRGDDFDGEVGRSEPVSLDLSRRFETLPAHESGVGGADCVGVRGDMEAGSGGV